MASKLVLFLSLIFIFVPASLAQDVVFEKARFSSVKVPIEVGVRLTITDSKILIESKKESKKYEPINIAIPFSAIESISHELAQRHRTREGAAVMGLSLGAGAVVMATKTKSYWLNIEYHEGNALQSVVLRLDKSEYEEVISTLQGRSGKQITTVKSKTTPFSPNAGSRDMDEVVEFRVDKIVPALERAMENHGCVVKKSTDDRVECKRKPGISERTGGNEKVTATLEAEGERTHVRIWTGKHFSEKTRSGNWSTPIYNAMMKSLQKPAQTAATSAPGVPLPPPGPQAIAQPAPPPAAIAPRAGSPATVEVLSIPDGADITVDGEFAGNTPSTLRMTPGDHTVVIMKSGMKTWKRTMTVSPDGILTVRAELEPAQ